MQQFDILDPHLNVFQSRFLEASAGTGKTFAIEHLVVRLLMESQDPISLQEILAVTFTREAAHEMKERIRTQLESLKASGNRRVKEALIHFDEIQVFTIHGFCFQMLKEFAFEAGAPLQMKSPEQAPPADEMRKTIEDFFRTGDKKFSGEIGSLLKHFRYNLDRLILEIIKAMQKEEVPKESLLPELPKISQEQLESDFILLAPRYKRFKPEKYTEQLKKFSHFLQKKDPAILLEEKEWFFEKMHEENAKVRAKELESYTLSSPGFFELLHRKLTPHLEIFRDPDEMLKRVAQECRQRWHVKALRGDHFTFDGLLSKMAASLEIPPFLEKVRSKYKAVIVDEFQDTDPLQWKIFEKLFLSSHLIYLVGDPKQSIYGFRSADIYTYLRAAQALGEEKKAFLDTNFRSSPKLVAELNALFLQNPTWLALPSMPSAIEYHPVKAGRSENKLDEEPIVYFGVQADPGRERSWPTKKMEEEKLFPYIASEVLRLHQQKNIPFGEMAILVKDRYQGQRMQRHLDVWKIPSSIKKTLNLAQSQGFIAMEMVLRATLQPDHDSLVRCALHGPFMQATNPTVKKETICASEAQPNRRGQAPVLNEEHHCQKGKGDEEDRFGKAEPVECLFFDGRVSNNANPFFALKQLFLEEGFTAFFAQFMKTYFKPSASLNLYKQLRQTAEILTSLGPVTIEEHLKLMKELKNSDPERDPRLELHGEEGQDKVPIMTTFASKGLEFEVVFALGMASRHLGEETNEERIAEKMRQLYVAFTRPREKLYIPMLENATLKPVTREEASPIELFFQDLSKPPIFWIEEISFQTHQAQKEQPILYKPKEIHLQFDPEYLTSFSSMAKPHTHSLLSQRFFLQDLTQNTSHTLPLGTETGTLIHALFETHFQDRSIPLDQVVFEGTMGTHLEGWEEVLLNMIQEALNMPLLEGGFCLNHLKEGEYLQEMEFLFPQENQLIKGFADLVFIKDDVFYLVDWKTNWLGPSEKDYTEDKLHQAMQDNDYYLQAKLYSEAILRYVKQLYHSPRFGGAYYIFLRGKKYVRHR